MMKKHIYHIIFYLPFITCLWFFRRTMKSNPYLSLEWYWDEYPSSLGQHHKGLVLYFKNDAFLYDMFWLLLPCWGFCKWHIGIDNLFDVHNLQFAPIQIPVTKGMRKWYIWVIFWNLSYGHPWTISKTIHTYLIFKLNYLTFFSYPPTWIEKGK